MLAASSTPPALGGERTHRDDLISADAERFAEVVVRDSRAVYVPVEVGIAGEQHFEIRRGLRPGETVVAGPYEAVRALKDGDLVRAGAPAAAPAGSR